jgi:hypothetical protein
MTMFVTQLANFLAAHHHPHWAATLATAGPLRFTRELAWAVRHGFFYSRLGGWG